VGETGNASQENRRVDTSSRDLNLWLGRESAGSLSKSSEYADLVDELKVGLSFVRTKAREHGKRRDGRLKVGPSISLSKGSEFL
jgi:hypothetical protein